MTPRSGTGVVVRPAGAERESLFVLLLCAAILCGAATIVGLRTTATQTTTTTAWQIDARNELTAAEQGIHADLRVAAEEISFAQNNAGMPTPKSLADDGLPPFTDDATARARGGHEWRLMEGNGYAGWFGRTASPDVAGSFLLRIAASGTDAIEHHGHEGRSAPTVSIWLNRSESADADSLASEPLIASGWKEIVSFYDASVTREGTP